MFVYFHDFLYDPFVFLGTIAIVGLGGLACVATFSPLQPKQ